MEPGINFNINALLSDESFPVSHSFFIWGCHISVVYGVHEDLCLQHREECGYAFGVGEVKSVVACHYIHHAVSDVLFREDKHRHCANGQDAVGLAHNDDRAEEWSCLEEGVGVFRRLKHKKKKQSQNNSLFRDYGQAVEHKKNCILSYMHGFLTSRMWSIPSLACPNFLGGAIGDGNMSGKAFIMAMVCLTVKNKTV